MTNKIPFYELGDGRVVLMLTEGEVPSARDDAQLAHVIALCSLMQDCWAFDPESRPSIDRCCTELKWIVSSALVSI